MPLDLKKRHWLENDALARHHVRKKLNIERRKRMLIRVETRERQSFENAMSREQWLEEATRLAAEIAAAQAHTVGIKAAQGFYDAARDQKL